MADQLCTTDEVRTRLLLPDLGPYDEQLAILDALRLAVEEVILARTAYTFTGGLRTEQQTDVQLGVPRVVQYRPVLPLSADPLKAIKLEARSLASNTWSTIIGDIKDAQTGRVVALASELTPIFPPVGGTAPWYRWRQMIWPVVRFTYSVDPLGSATNPVPAALNRAAVEWTAAIYARPAGGAIDSWSVEKVSESYVEASEPKVVAMLLARHVRERAVLAF